MSRGSEIAIGLVSALLSGVLLLIAPTVGVNAPIGLAGFLMVAAIFGILAFALLIKWGRPISTRIAVGAVSAGGICAAIGSAISGNINGMLAVFGLISGGGLFYAITGTYPDSLPLSEVFNPAVPKKAKTKKNPAKPQKKRPRLTPLEDE